MSTSAPTLEELRSAANTNCTSETLARLAGYIKKKEENNLEKDSEDDIIVVKRRTGPSVPRDEYAQQYRKNCFYQFRHLCDTKQSFFGVDDDEEARPAAEKANTIK